MIGSLIASYGVYIAGGALVTAAAGAGAYSLRSSPEADPEELHDEDLSEGKGTGFTRKPAQTSDGLPGVRWMKKRNRRRKEKNALSKGYVRWHLVSDALSKPRYVKPEREEGGNVPEFEYEDETYLFPESAMVPDAEDGIWTVVHREGKAEPLNLREGDDDALDANALNEYLNMRVTSQDPNGGLSLPGLGNLSTQELMQYTLVAIVIGAVVYTVI
jgi:hypothetical protein